MRNYLWAAVTAALLATPQVALSFDTEAIPIDTNEQMGRCSVVTHLMPPTNNPPFAQGGSASIKLYFTGAIEALAFTAPDTAGRYWNYGLKAEGRSAA